jgi:PAS domain S-box-containing protein
MLPDIRIRQRDILLEIARTLTRELDLDRVLEKILRFSVEILDGVAGIIALPEDGPYETGGWRIAASVGVNPAFLQEIETILKNAPNLRNPAGNILPEIDRRMHRLTRLTTLGWLSSLGLPMTAQRAVVGVAYVFRSGQAQFSENERALLQSFADQAAVAVSNARLFAQVREEKQRLDAILESSAEGTAILGADNRIQRFNRAIVRMSGIPAEQAVGAFHDDILRFECIRAGQTLSQAEAGGWPLSDQAVFYLEADLIRKEGKPLSVGVTYAPVFTSERSLLNIVLGMRDLTRFREAEEMKSTFISTISHELKTPVALIKGYANTLRREDAHWEKSVVEDSLSVIEEEADRLTSLIEDLLDASRLQAGGLKLNFGEVDLPRLTSRIAERISRQYPDRPIRPEFPKDFPPVTADEERIGQVISNLLVNAIKYSPPAEPVTVRGKVTADEVVLCVKDMGAGIRKEDLPHVFDPFFRAAETAKRTKGAGLGLYLAKAVVEAHGGRIWIDSTLGAGAQVSFSLPRVQNP